MKMPWSDGFYCTYCGKDFGNEHPDKLALHIRDFHEKELWKAHVNDVMIAPFSKLKKKQFLSLSKHLLSLTVWPGFTMLISSIQFSHNSYFISQIL